MIFGSIQVINFMFLSYELQTRTLVLFMMAIEMIADAVNLGACCERNIRGIKFNNIIYLISIHLFI